MSRWLNSKNEDGMKIRTFSCFEEGDLFSLEEDYNGRVWLKIHGSNNESKLLVTRGVATKLALKLASMADNRMQLC